MFHAVPPLAAAAAVRSSGVPEPIREELMDEVDLGAIGFYSRHPISSTMILVKLRAGRGSLESVSPPDLFPYDQDHYGGLEANDALARATAIGEGSRVADFCAGLGGPARYLAWKYGADVTGVDLTPARVKGAAELTALVGLADRVRVVEGDVTRAPLPDRSFDAVISQEAFLHVPDKGQTIREAFRVLRPGGRFAFTDWVAHRPLSADDAELFWQGQAVRNLQSVADYRGLIEDAGFRLETTVDLTAAWADILRKRLEMYRTLRDETRAAGAPSGHDAFYRSYVRLVDLVGAGDLGGARFAARKPPV
jgi:ubiquinone/menaquinone biosynthesis C-methylase UbiE